MPRLVINAGTPQAKQLDLKQGTNYIGRGFANDFQIEDSSVSSRHCQVVINGNQIFFKDLGSTNGSFVNGTAIQEAILQNGQTLRLGGINLLFQDDSVGSVNVASIAATTATPAVAAAPAIAAVPAVNGLRLSGASVAPVAAAATVSSVSPPPVPSGGLRLSGSAVATAPPPSAPAIPIPPAVPSAAARPSGKSVCRYHPKAPSRWLCPKCGHQYCDLCVGSRAVAEGTGHFCRPCGEQCSPVTVQIDVGAISRKTNFFVQLPGVFTFPFKAGGLWILIFGTIFFTAMNMLPGMRMYLIYLSMMGVGYIFAYMQKVIHMTASGEDEEATVPDISNFWDDVLIPCFQLLGMVLIIFGPAFALMIWAGLSENSSVGIGIIPAVLFGVLYLPMAFLAVAMFDTITAINPLVVIPAIIKVPVHYFIAFILLATVFVVRWASANVLAEVIPIQILPDAISNFIGLYCLTVEARVLGILYLANKHKLGWFNH